MFQSERNINVLVSDTDCEDVRNQGAAAATERPRVIVKRPPEATWKGNLRQSEKAMWGNIRSLLLSWWEKVKEAQLMMRLQNLTTAADTEKQLGKILRAHVLGNNFENAAQLKNVKRLSTWVHFFLCTWLACDIRSGWGGWSLASQYGCLGSCGGVKIKWSVKPGENAIRGVISVNFL